MIVARWFDSRDPFDRRICVEVSNEVCYIMTRDKPGDVWSPPKVLHLDTMLETSGHVVEDAT